MSCYIQLDLTVTDRIVAEVFCSGSSVVDFVTSSPIGMQHSSVVYQGNGR